MSMKWMPALGSGIPFARLALGGIALVGAAGWLAGGFTCGASHGEYQLSLEVQDISNARCYYGSRFGGGNAVLLDHDASDGRTVIYKQLYPYLDGCWWEATETLTPTDGGKWSYYYSEHVVTCEEGAEPGLACTRSGEVTPLSLK